ncbi:MAG: hypothetical protein SFX72_07870 [Isosphaeraceae bacterium]|nr:hypothetical protein [Isosphaeraceae bacterium]
MRACLRLIAQVNFAVCLLIVAGSISTVALAEPPVIEGGSCGYCCYCSEGNQTCFNPNPPIGRGCAGFVCACTCYNNNGNWLCAG